jgi:hypothetical protein
MAKNDEEPKVEYADTKQFRVAASTPIGKVVAYKLSVENQKQIEEAIREGKREITFEGVISIDEIEPKDQRPTEERIKEAVEYCKTNEIKLTVRNVAKYSDLSLGTVHNYRELFRKT